MITYSLSAISASLGLAKCLKNGVARPIGAGGCLDGLLSARFLLAFFASGFCAVMRGLCLGYLGYYPEVVELKLLTFPSFLFNVLVGNPLVANRTVLEMFKICTSTPSVISSCDSL